MSTPAQLGVPITLPESTEPAPADAKPKRPTTREGRRAAAEAKAAAAKAAGAAPAKADKPPASRPKVTQRDVAASITTLHEMAGAGAQIVGMPATGAALIASGPEAGAVWADAVKRYPQLERLFGASTDGLILFRLVMVYAPLISLAVGERSAAAGKESPLADVVSMMAGAGPTVVPDGQNTGGRP